MTDEGGERVREGEKEKESLTERCYVLIEPVVPTNLVDTRLTVMTAMTVKNSGALEN